MKRFLSYLVLSLCLILPAQAFATLTVTNTGAAQMLKVITGQAAEETLVCHLWVGAHTPAVTDTASTFTSLEATYTGYAAQNLATWSAPSGSPETTTPAQLTFTWTGGSTAVWTGYYIVGGTSGVLYWEETLPVAFTPATSGDTMKLTCPFQLQ